MTNVADTLRQHSDYLRPNPTARLDAEVLLAHCLGVDRTSLFREPEREVTTLEERTLRGMVNERKMGRPVAQLVGRAEFYSREFQVSPAVLTPRADTELLVDQAIQIAAERPLRIIDLGTGSGAIGISIALYCANSIVYALDICPQALEVAGANLHTHRPENFHLIRSDWLDSLADNTMDLVVSNPPYIESDDSHMRDTSISFEPKLALDGGHDGLSPYRRLVPEARRVLKPNGHLLLEHGYNQGAAVRTLLTSQGFTEVVTLRDLAQHERVCQGVLKNNPHETAS